MKSSDVNTVTQERDSENKKKKVNSVSLEYLNTFYCRYLQTVKILTDKFVFNHGLRKFIFQGLIIEPRD